MYVGDANNRVIRKITPKESLINEKVKMRHLFSTALPLIGVTTSKSTKNDIYFEYGAKDNTARTWY